MNRGREGKTQDKFINIGKTKQNVLFCEKKKLYYVFKLSIQDPEF